MLFLDVLHWDCLNREALNLTGDSQILDIHCPICKVRGAYIE